MDFENFRHSQLGPQDLKPGTRHLLWELKIDLNPQMVHPDRFPLELHMWNTYVSTNAAPPEIFRLNQEIAFAIELSNTAEEVFQGKCLQAVLDGTKVSQIGEERRKYRDAMEQVDRVLQTLPHQIFRGRKNIYALTENDKKLDVVHRVVETAEEEIVDTTRRAAINLMRRSIS